MDNADGFVRTEILSKSAFVLGKVLRSLQLHFFCVCEGLPSAVCRFSYSFIKTDLRSWKDLRWLQSWVVTWAFCYIDCARCTVCKKVVTWTQCLILLKLLVLLSGFAKEYSKYKLFVCVCELQVCLLQWMIGCCVTWADLALPATVLM